ncbi:hypothetical protein PAXINDRAFT_11122 [Paxillus involutus ATCC 200175]|nr:hypothetical protein PAXINDRAFT_11122 [Paxillus involutus ATCC 200175]
MDGNLLNLTMERLPCFLTCLWYHQQEWENYVQRAEVAQMVGGGYAEMVHAAGAVEMVYITGVEPGDEYIVEACWAEEKQGVVEHQ